jgi:F-type H+-transporting ATPase subunit a
LHFTWFHLIPGLAPYDHVVTAATCTLIVIFISLFAYAVAGKPEEALLPDQKFTARGFFEVVVESISSLLESVMGEEGQIYLGITGSIFIYILVLNFFGLVPGFAPASSNMNTTLAVGLFSFVLYNFEGIRAHGFGYAKHFLGPLLWLAPLMLPLELISHMVRPVTLGLRLFGNMTGDHAVLGAFIGLVPIGVPMAFYALGMFVCFMQAFIFTLLSMVYISMATAHDH